MARPGEAWRGKDRGEAGLGAARHGRAWQGSRIIKPKKEATNGTV